MEGSSLQLEVMQVSGRCLASKPRSSGCCPPLALFGALVSAKPRILDMIRDAAPAAFLPKQPSATGHLR